jgi:hypothetical protein
MSKKASIIYLALAPVLFGLSWYISHRLFQRFMTNNATQHDVEVRSMVYAGIFAGLYLAAWFVIRDLYTPGKNKN